MPRKVIQLKTDSVPFQNIKKGVKRFEIRKNDRDFNQNDVLVLQETRNTGRQMAEGAPLVYTGETYRVVVVHILEQAAGLDPDYVIMSIMPSAKQG